MIYILINQTYEDDVFVRYEFGPSEERLGTLQILKKNGTTSVICEVPGDTTAVYSSRAQRKVWLHWRSGEYPKKTCWAS